MAENPLLSFFPAEINGKSHYELLQEIQEFNAVYCQGISKIHVSSRQALPRNFIIFQADLCRLLHRIFT